MPIELLSAGPFPFQKGQSFTKNLTICKKNKITSEDVGDVGKFCQRWFFCCNLGKTVVGIIDVKESIVGKSATV